jgi:hypothetical protein
MLPDAGEVFTNLSGILNLQVKSWTGWPPDDQGANASLTADNVVYVVNCPGVHSFTLEELQKLSLDSATRDVSDYPGLDICFPHPTPQLDMQ